jgi:hypothetical protein
MKDEDLKVGDLCVAAYLPLQHIWKVGVIESITEHGTYHVDCGYNSKARATDWLFLRLHEIRVPPKATKLGDIFKGDIFKKPNMNEYTMTVVPEQRIWVVGKYDVEAMHP